ncbi:hypothetical protein PAMP_022235 [Pampus punctatissimus]
MTSTSSAVSDTDSVAVDYPSLGCGGLVNKEADLGQGDLGGGRAAGELVLDCQRCPVYHLDELIVLQSQLSSLENCVDLHTGQQGRGAGCYHTSQMAGPNLGLETRTEANPLAKLVPVAADSSSVGSSFTTAVTPTPPLMA